MQKITDIYPYSQKPHLNPNNNLWQIEKYLSDFFNQPAIILGSARVGIYQALKFFSLKRWDHILVPDFLCQSILNILNISSFPVKYLDKRTKAVLLFHQWGYPQDMDKVLPEIRKHKLIIIEDCAHAFDSKYKGQKIGTFGDLAVFSFSKTFPTFIGGVFTSSNSDLINFVQIDKKKKNNFYNKFFNYFAFKTAKKSFIQNKWRFILDSIYLKSIYHPNISNKAIKLLPANLEKFKEELKKRKNNYLFLKNNIKSSYLPIDQNPDIDVNPISIPVFLKEKLLSHAQQKLNKNKIFTEILHFDINRNIFNPDYKKCLALPCHQHLNKKQLFLMVDIINNF